jgi:DNA-directed RNA polymerase subunit K
VALGPGCRARWVSNPGGQLIFPKEFTKYEKARIIGARALQIAMGAPVLIDLPEGLTDPIEMALFEFDKKAIPITVVRRLPEEKWASPLT